MSGITTHVLDVVLGKPAAGVAVRLDKAEGGSWIEVATGVTDIDGRCRNLASDADAGTYQLRFGTGDYLAAHSRTTIYPEISISFTCSGDADYHLPLLLSDNSYTTYRGS